jgi:hypothetical protein
LTLAEEQDKEKSAKNWKELTYLWFIILMYGHPFAIAIPRPSRNEAWGTLMTLQFILLVACSDSTKYDDMAIAYLVSVQIRSKTS